MTTLTLLLCVCCCFASAAMAASTHQAAKLEYIYSAERPEAACPQPTTTATPTGRSTVPLSHRHGPCAPVPSKERSLSERLRHDVARAGYVHQATGGYGYGLQRSDPAPTLLGDALGSEEYVVTVGIGSPAFGQTLILDTGSHVSWVRCNTQFGTPFDPSASSSYTPFSCSATACAQLGGQWDGCSQDQCQYRVNYQDGSYTAGTYSSDTLTLTGSEAITGFQFGCSHTDNVDARIDGLLGLSSGVQSLPSQTAAYYGRQFSYCLPASPRSSGFLTLGAPADESGFTMTRLIRKAGSEAFYVLLLQAIIVDGEQLEVPPSVFSGGSVLDSGTVVTRLPTAAYAALSSAFKAGMTEYPPGPPNGILDTCFNISGKVNVTTPRVALVFDGGAVVELDADGVLDSGCLAFAASDYVSIIGNVQQRRYEVLHDVVRGVVGFRAGAC